MAHDPDLRFLRSLAGEVGERLPAKDGTGRADMAAGEQVALRRWLATARGSCLGYDISRVPRGIVDAQHYCAALEGDREEQKTISHNASVARTRKPAGLSQKLLPHFPQ